MRRIARGLWISCHSCHLCHFYFKVRGWGLSVEYLLRFLGWIAFLLAIRLPVTIVLLLYFLFGGNRKIRASKLPSIGDGKVVWIDFFKGISSGAF